MNKKPRWRDAEGNLYTDGEIILKDIDTPGPQFYGHVTKASVALTGNVDQWVKVFPIAKRKQK